MTALLIIMALVITGLGSFILIEKAKNENPHIMQPPQYNQYNNYMTPNQRPNPIPINNTNEGVEDRAPKNKNKIKIEIEQTNQDQNKIEISIDPKAKNNNVNTSIKNNPRLTNYQQRLIDNHVHRPAIAHKPQSNNPTITRKSQTNNISSKVHRPVTNNHNKIQPQSISNKAHKPVTSQSLYTPKAKTTINKPQITSNMKQRQRTIDKLNKDKERIIQELNHKSETKNHNKHVSFDKFKPTSSTPHIDEK